jgi:segregation and condensation protein B
LVNDGKPFSANDLVEVLEITRKELDGMVEELNAGYIDRKSGFQIIQVAGGFQVATNPLFRDELSELFGKRNESQMTKSALETLAIVAYKQPISKDDVDKIRGVSSTRSINALLGFKMITISGSTDGIVKMPLYSTTDRFLEMFHINSLDDLPDIESLNYSDLIEDDDAGEEEQTERDGDENELELSM